MQAETFELEETDQNGSFHSAMAVSKRVKYLGAKPEKKEPAAIFKEEN
jgi:hypothetical protein